MSPRQDDDRRLGWLEALHEAVVSGQDEAFSRDDARVSQAEDFDALRDWLHKQGALASGSTRT